MKRRVVDYGDVGYWVGAKATEFMVEDSYKHAKKILDAGCSLMTIGGDHTIPVRTGESGQREVRKTGAAAF